jgi:hypothetical protein
VSVENLTPAVALSCVRDLCAQSHAWLVRKGDVPGMALIRAAFDALRALGVPVPTGAEFDRCSHAVAAFAVIADDLSPEELLEAGTHECTHVRQFWAGEYRPHSTVGATLEGGAAFAWLYLVNPEARVRFEARAYRAGLEVRHALGLPLPTLDQLTDTLARGYALDAHHVAFGRALLESALLSVRSGVVSTESGAAMLAILRRHMVIA